MASERKTTKGLEIVEPSTIPSRKFLQRPVVWCFLALFVFTLIIVLVIFLVLPSDEKISPNPLVPWSEIFSSKVSGESIEIPLGQRVLFDLPNSPVYGSIIILGRLEISQALSTQLNAEEIRLYGQYECGSPEKPFPRQLRHIIELSGPRSEDPTVASPGTAPLSSHRSLMQFPGSSLTLYGETTRRGIVKLAETANVGASSIRVREAMDLFEGDELELTTSKYWQEGLTDAEANYGDASNNANFLTRRPGFGREIVVVAARVVNETIIPLRFPLQSRHHGQLQYLVPPRLEDFPNTSLRFEPYDIRPEDDFSRGSGVSINGSHVLKAIRAGASPIVDNCATVGLLTRPIQLRAANDSDWKLHGYGAGITTTGLNSITRLQGLQMIRVGKAGHLGQYPLHQHMRSYNASGFFLGDVEAENNFLRYCSILQSANRAVVLHATNGFQVVQNSFVLIDTHAIFLEDGSERRNRIEGNLISSVGLIGYGKIPIKRFDAILFGGPHYVGGVLGPMGPAGIWFSSPDNYLIKNIVAGAYIGIWNSFSDTVFGLSKAVSSETVNEPYYPARVDPLEWLDNESHSCVFKCLTTNPVVIDDLGSIQDGGNLFGSANFPNRRTLSKFSGASLWKCGQAWYSNEVFQPNYTRWRLAAAKNQNPLVFGSGITKAIFGRVAGSLYGGPPPEFHALALFTKTLDDFYSSERPSAMVSYHNAITLRQSLVVPAAMSGLKNEYLGENFDQNFLQDGGLMSLHDFYENQVELGFQRATEVAILGAQPGIPGLFFPPVHALPLYFPSYRAVLDRPEISRNLAKAYSGARKLPADGSFLGSPGWWVYDMPFFLHGTTGSFYAPSPAFAPQMNGRIVSPDYCYYGIKVLKASDRWVSGDSDSGGSVATGFAINYTRLDNSSLLPVGTWNIPKAAQINFPNKRHAAILHGGLVKTSWAREEIPLPQSLRLELTVMHRSDAYFYWVLDWNATVPVDFAYLIVDRTSNYNVFSAAATKEELLSTQSDCKYFVEESSSELWLAIFGGNLAGRPDFENSQNDEYLMKYATIRVNTRN